MNELYASKEYKRSRIAYAGQCTFEYLILLLVSDAFLANLLTNIGISDALTGIISSFVSFAFLFQLLSIVIVRKINNSKRTVIICSCAAQLLFMLLYLIPFVPVSKGMKTFGVMLFIMLAYILNNMVSGLLFKWGNSYVNPAERARYSSVKEVISLVSGIVFTLIVGYIIDIYKGLGNIEGGFLFIASTMLILNICNFAGLAMIKKDSAKDASKENSSVVSDVIRHTLGNRNFRHVVIMTVIWYSARYMTEGFLGIYKIKDLAISIGTVQLINIVGNFGRIIISVPFGKFSDKRSYAVGMRFAFLISAAAYVTVIFTTPKTRWLIILYTLLYAVSMAGSNQNSFNIVYSYVDKNYIVEAMAIKNSIGGLCGFLISMVAGRILHHVQISGNSFLGLHIYGQQLLAFISLILISCAIAYTKLVIEKQKVSVQ